MMKNLFSIIALCLISAASSATPDGYMVDHFHPDGSGPYSYEIMCVGSVNCVLTYDKSRGSEWIQWKVLPAPTARSFSYTTRGLNTCFQPSATRDAAVSYAVDISTSLSLLAGQQGTVYMEIFTNSACTTGSQEVTRFVNGQTGALTIGLALTQNVTGTLNGIIPAGTWVKLRTENNTGTPTFTARPGQETLL